jgi:hypothetical protein
MSQRLCNINRSNCTAHADSMCEHSIQIGRWHQKLEYTLFIPRKCYQKFTILIRIPKSIIRKSSFSDFWMHQGRLATELRLDPLEELIADWRVTAPRGRKREMKFLFARNLEKWQSFCKNSLLIRLVNFVQNKNWNCPATIGGSKIFLGSLALAII